MITIVDSEEDSDDFLEMGDSDSDIKPAKFSSPRTRKMPPPPARAVNKTANSAIPYRRRTMPSSSAKGSTKRQSKVPASTRRASSASSALTTQHSSSESVFDSDNLGSASHSDSDDDDDDNVPSIPVNPRQARQPRGRRVPVRRSVGEGDLTRRGQQERDRLEHHHPELLTMWKDLEDLPKIGNSKIEQPKTINRELKPFQLEGVAWMKAMEETEWGGGLLGDEM